MNHHYSDIVSRIKEEPKWYDENAVPRYSDFGPDEVADIYADEVALVLIKCQGCKTEFRVAFSRSVMDIVRGSKRTTIAEAIQAKELHYGDPPNAGCCASGPTMNSEPHRVLEYWSCHDPKFAKDGKVVDVKYFDWQRNPELEVDITPDWVNVEEKV